MDKQHPDPLQNNLRLENLEPGKASANLVDRLFNIRIPLLLFHILTPFHKSYSLLPAALATSRDCLPVRLVVNFP